MSTYHGDVGLNERDVKQRHQVDAGEHVEGRDVPRDDRGDHGDRSAATTKTAQVNEIKNKSWGTS